MSDERVEKLYAKADNLLLQAADELNKPEEDVVTYSACISARSALYHFLGSFYVYKTKDEADTSLEEGEKTMDELIQFAEQHISDIGKIDFSTMRCTCKDVKSIVNDEEIYFCNSVDIVKVCTDLAGQVKSLLIRDAFGGQAPVDSTTDDA